MNISVILCTYNRCDSLVRALTSVAAQVLPASTDWEVLVVDNNSTDETRAVVSDFCSRYPGRFRYIFEAKSGKSNALNSAISQARGGILAFLDDDVTPEPSWLQNLTSGLHSGEWMGAGGRILPLQAVSLPRWISTEIPRSLDPWAMFDRGLESGPLIESPFGTNMAFRKEVFERHGGFRTDLGPRPGSKIRSEDTEFGKRVLAAGERLRYEPASVVFHAVPEERLRKEYFLEWWLDKGRADVRESTLPSNTNWLLFGNPLYVYRRIAMWTLRWFFALEPARRFYAKRQVWWLAGGILESYRQSRGRASDQP